MTTAPAGEIAIAAIGMATVVGIAAAIGMADGGMTDGGTTVAIIIDTAVA